MNERNGANGAYKLDTKTHAFAAPEVYIICRSSIHTYILHSVIHINVCLINNKGKRTKKKMSHSHKQSESHEDWAELNG